MTLRRLIAAAALFVASAGGPVFAAPAPSPHDVLLVSDVHFNPFDDPSLVDDLRKAPASQWHAILARTAKAASPYFVDTNFPLLESALAAMRANAPDPPVVVISGDFLAHDFPLQFSHVELGAPPGTYETFVDKTIAFLASEFDAAYPRAQFVIVVGNNDGYCGDYRSTPHSPFLAHMAGSWAPLVNRGGRAPGFAQTFPDAGYYVATLPGTAAGTRVVALNAVYWSSFYANACGVAGSDPGADELRWLDATLPQDTTGRTIVVTHISPGIDEYSSMVAGKPVPFLEQSYEKHLLATLASHGPRVRGILAGHMHHASFEVAESGDGPIPVLVIPSISPIQGNNPSFEVARIGADDATIEDLTAYYLPLGSPSAVWAEEYSFDDAYGFKAFDAKNLFALQASLETDAAERARFISYYNSESTIASPNPKAWPWLWCGHLNLTVDAYSACLAKELPPAKASPAPQ